MNRVYVAPKPTKRGLKNAKWPFFVSKVDLSRKRSMLLVFWCRVLSDPCHHPPPTQNLPTLQRGFSATAELLVPCMMDSRLLKLSRVYLAFVAGEGGAFMLVSITGWNLSVVSQILRCVSGHKRQTTVNNNELVPILPEAVVRFQQLTSLTLRKHVV